MIPVNNPTIEMRTITDYFVFYRPVMLMGPTGVSMLYERIKEQHSTSYLTLMSIIQGVALSFFTFAIGTIIKALHLRSGYYFSVHS